MFLCYRGTVPELKKQQQPKTYILIQRQNLLQTCGFQILKFLNLTIAENTSNWSPVLWQVRWSEDAELGLIPAAQDSQWIFPGRKASKRALCSSSTFPEQQGILRWWHVPQSLLICCGRPRVLGYPVEVIQFPLALLKHESDRWKEMFETWSGLP